MIVYISTRINGIKKFKAVWIKQEKREFNSPLYRGEKNQKKGVIK